MGYCGWCPYLNKWITFTASIAVALCCGLTYAFSIWSGALKNAYDLNQAQLELVAAAANVGGYSGIFSGLVYDSLEKHKKFGPRITLLLGLLANAGGYLGLWAAITGRFRAQFWQLCALAFIAANGGTWGDTSILTTNIKNFPSSRGSVVGVLKAAIGLSGSLFASVYSGVFLPDKTSFLLFLALAPVVVGLLALPWVNHCSFVQKSELESGQHVFTAEGRFIFALQALGTLGVYLITGATFNSIYPLSQSARLTVTVGAGLLLLPLLLIPHGSGGLLSQKAVLHHALSHYQDQEDPPPEDEEAAAAGGNGHGAAGSSLTQPLLQPGMQRDAAAADAAAAPAATVAVTGHSSAGEAEEGSEADSELAAAIAASLKEAEAAGLGQQAQPDGAARQLDLEPAVVDPDAPDLISFEPAVLDDSAHTANSAAVDGLAPPPGVEAAAGDAFAPPASAALPAPAGDDRAAHPSQPANGRPPSPFAEPGPQARLPPELSPLQCLRSSEFWLLFLVLSIGMGSGLALVNNLSQLVKALTGGASALDTTPVLVSAFSVCNCAGRMALGYLPERLLHARGTPRIAFLPLMSALMAATCLGLAFAHLPALYPLSALAGFAFGGHWSLFPSLISELFGLARFAANYTLMQFAPALGAFGLAAGLAGWLYERALARHGTEGNTCVGQDCFQATFITLAALGLVATAAATVLYRRERQVYAAEYQEVHAYDEEVQRHGRQSASPSPQPR